MNRAENAINLSIAILTILSILTVSVFGNIIFADEKTLGKMEKTLSLFELTDRTHQSLADAKEDATVKADNTFKFEGTLKFLKQDMILKKGLLGNASVRTGEKNSIENTRAIDMKNITNSMNLKSDVGNIKVKSPKTGDTMDILKLAIVLVVAAFAIICVIYAKRSKQTDRNINK